MITENKLFRQFHKSIFISDKIQVHLYMFEKIVCNINWQIIHYKMDWNESML